MNGICGTPGCAACVRRRMCEKPAGAKHGNASVRACQRIGTKSKLPTSVAPASRRLATRSCTPSTLAASPCAFGSARRHSTTGLSAMRRNRYDPSGSCCRYCNASCSCDSAAAGCGRARVRGRMLTAQQEALTLSREPGAGVSESLWTLAKSLRSAASSAESTTPTCHTTRVAPGRSMRADHQPARSLAVTSCAERPRGGGAQRGMTRGATTRRRYAAPPSRVAERTRA